jgi:hypothetical protein
MHAFAAVRPCVYRYPDFLDMLVSVRRIPNPPPPHNAQCAHSGRLAITWSPPISNREKELLIGIKVGRWCSPCLTVVLLLVLVDNLPYRNTLTRGDNACVCLRHSCRALSTRQSLTLTCGTS